MTSPSIYAEIGVSTEVMSASPHRIVQLLLEKFLQHANMAKMAMERNDRASRNQSVAKANDIILHLRSCLKSDTEDTKKFSEQIDTTYSLVQRCLLNATLKNDPEYLDLTITMISNIKSAWDQIG